MKNCLFILALVCSLIACEKNEKALAKNTPKESSINCTDRGCSGTYKGPEFINGSDVAHQFSNTMSKVVGNKLKDLYRDQNYKKVDFTAITMTTNGMGSGKVTYYLYIPFKDVTSNCEAYTSFDHGGGWNHAPALASRQKQLQPLLLKDQELDISDLKTTPEGLQEYWIQWKHKKVQGDCE